MRINKRMISALIVLSGWIIMVLAEVHWDSRKLVAIIWLLTGVVFLLFNRQIIFRCSLEQKIWIFFVFYVIFNTLYNIFAGTDNTYGAVDLIVECVFVYIIPLCISYLFSNIRIQYKLFLYFRTFIIACSVLGIFEYITKSQFYQSWITAENALYNFRHYSNFAGDYYRLTLLFFHPMYYSVLLTVGLVCILYIPLKNRLLQIFSVFLILMNLVLTQSRTGWVVALMVIVLFVIKNGIHWMPESIKVISPFRLIAVGVLLAVLVRIIFWDSMIQIFSSRIAQILSGDALGARLANFSLINLVLESPGGLLVLIFGGGSRFGLTFLQYHPMTDGWTRAIDNQYITVLLDSGIIGLSVLLSFIGVIFYKFFSKHQEPAREIPYLAVIAIMISALTFEPIGSNIIGYLLMILIGQMSCESGKTKIIGIHFDRVFNWKGALTWELKNRLS